MPNPSERFWPTVVIVAIGATAIRAAMKPHSIAVASCLLLHGRMSVEIIVTPKDVLIRAGDLSHRSG